MHARWHHDFLEDSKAAHLAGLTFKHYRQAGGPRQYLVPDFLVAAHAKVQANRLAAIDRGYLRRWFPDLQLLDAGSSSPEGPSDAGTG